MKPYEIILADPPWKYANTRTRANAESHYPTMDLAEICALPVEGIAADNAALFLWATFPRLPDAFEVISAWGFTFKTAAFVWVKQNRKSPGLFWGLGNWTRANAEICLLAVRGHPVRADKAVHQVIVSPVGSHSQKPQEARARIVRLLGDLPRIELFAREKPPGWDTWGNETNCDISFEWEGGDLFGSDFQG